MRLFSMSVIIGLFLAAVAGGATSEKTPVRAASIPSHFEGTGKVTMHPGRPCTSQIMFDFRAGRSRNPIWLAALMRDSRILTEAARHRRSVRIAGVWRRGLDGGCSYVNVTSVTVQKSFFTW
jgi:hypothetical protein